MQHPDGGCACPDCLDLAAYMRGLTGRTYGLPETAGCPARQAVTLRVLTTDPEPPANLVPLHQPCTGTLTCSCPACEQERSRLARRAREPVRQPWEPRPARRAA